MCLFYKRGTFNLWPNFFKLKAFFRGFNKPDTIFYQVYCALLHIENDVEIFPAHCTWKVAEKGFKMALMINKLAKMNSCEIILEK